jgi:hypothetical protein
MREGRVCTRCDPVTCGKCRNTPERRQKLKRAAEAKAAAEQEAREKADREAQAKRKKLLDSLGATPKSARVPSTPQTSSTADPSNASVEIKMPKKTRPPSTSLHRTKPTSNPNRARMMRTRQLPRFPTMANNNIGRRRRILGLEAEMAVANPTQIQRVTIPQSRLRRKGQLRRAHNKLRREVVEKLMQMAANHLHEKYATLLRQSHDCRRTRVPRMQVPLVEMQFSMQKSNSARGTLDTESWKMIPSFRRSLEPTSF